MKFNERGICYIFYTLERASAFCPLRDHPHHILCNAFRLRCIDSFHSMPPSLTPNSSLFDAGLLSHQPLCILRRRRLRQSHKRSDTPDVPLSVLVSSTHLRLAPIHWIAIRTTGESALIAAVDGSPSYLTCRTGGNSKLVCITAGLCTGEFVAEGGGEYAFYPGAESDRDGIGHGLFVCNLAVAGCGAATDDVVPDDAWMCQSGCNLRSPFPGLSGLTARMNQVQVWCMRPPFANKTHPFERECRGLPSCVCLLFAHQR
jgi:hypothetical protein